MDESGPGALVRLWSANPERGGNVRVEIDGETVVDAPFADWLAGRSGVGAPFASQRGGGSVWLAPLPYADALRISLDASTGDGLFYTTEIRRYAPGTAVRGATRSDLEAVRRHPVAQRLTAPSGIAVPGRTLSVAGEASPGGDLVLALPEGGGVVRRLRVHADTDDLLLVMVTDGAQVAEVPIGSAFGTGPGRAPYETWWASATRDGWLEMRLPIPYGDPASIALRTGGGVHTATIEAAVDASVPPGDTRLHGAWRSATLATRPASVWRGADLAGPGIWVADTLVVDNPVSGWWGAGDVLVTVDDGALPGLAAPGTEDHYGAAWCSHETFAAVLAAQPRSDAPVGPAPCDAAQGTSVWTRGRALDRVPFPRRLTVDLEVRHRQDTQVRYSFGVWWYSISGGSP